MTPARSYQKMKWRHGLMSDLLFCREFGLADKGQKGFRGLFSRLVMCHMDLHPRNVILDSQGNAWLIDWEYAGMYPPYFETATVLRYGREAYFRGLLDLLGDKAYEEENSRLFSISFALTTGALCKPASVSDRLASPV
jgi:thiamine kinase-like enzyme